MKTTLKQLAIFVATASTKQISLAAKKCHVTQSAASMALTELETRLQQKLFNRIGKRLILNEMGRALLPKAQQIIEQAIELESFYQASVISGQLMIGASKTIGTYLLPKLLTDFLHQAPQVQLNYQLQNSEAILQAVLNAQIDVGFIEAPLLHPEVRCEVFAKDRLLIVASAAHPFARKRKLQWSDLIAYPWILREVGSGTREIFLRNISTHATELNIWLELNDAVAIKEFLKNSSALSCLAESVVASELDNKTLVALKIPELILERDLLILTRKTKYQSALLTQFVEFVKNQKI